MSLYIVYEMFIPKRVLTAMIGKDWKAQKLSNGGTNLYFSCLKYMMGWGEVFCALTPFF